MEQYVRDLSTIRTNRPVGSSFEYSNANYNVAGLIVEAVSGVSHADYVQQHIFAPLEMTNSAATPDAPQRLGLAEGYDRRFGLGPFPADEEFNTWPLSTLAIARSPSGTLPTT